MGTPWSGNGTINSTADVRAALDRVNTTAQQRHTTTALAQALHTGEHLEPSDNITAALPAHPDLAPLLPWHGGLKRGVTVSAVGSASLLMLLLAGAMRNTGSWAAVVGMPTFGFLAADEVGVPLDRLAVVPEPGPDWPTIVATLLDGVDMVIVQPPADVPASLAGMLSSRARLKGSVLVSTRTWSGAELTLKATGMRWHGLRDGGGRLRYSEVEVTATGRGKAARPRSTTLTLPPGGKRPPITFPPSQFIAAADNQVAATNPFWERMEPSPAPVDLWASLSQ